MDRPGCRMIHLPNTAFLSGIALVAGHLTDVVLKVLLVLPDIMPQSRNLSPIPVTEHRGKLFGKSPDALKMRFKPVFRRGTILFEAYMCNRSSHQGILRTAGSVAMRKNGTHRS